MTELTGQQYATATKELVVKRYLQERAVPALLRVLVECNPSRFAEWHGSACRQVAVLSVQYLNRALPEFQWQMWEGVFSYEGTDGRMKVYDHAWVWGRGAGWGRYVDLAHVASKRVWCQSARNQHHAPVWVEHKRRQVCMASEIAGQHEFYTGLLPQALYSLTLKAVASIGTKELAAFEKMYCTLRADGQD